jgi:hypothetical protein
MILQRTHDVDAVNALVNDPAIRPFVGGEGYVDLSEPAGRQEHLFLMGEHGGFALIWSAPGAFEVHTFILASGRGAWARSAALDGINQAKAKGARMLWTRVPRNLPHVVAFATEMGMKATGETIETWGKPYDVLAMEV